MSDTKKLTEEELRLEAVKAIREKRAAIGNDMGSSLHASLREGYFRYWFNNEVGQIEMRLASGWTHVMRKDTEVGTKRAQDEAHDSEKVSRVVNRGVGARSTIAYLMEIPNEIHEDDVAARLDKMHIRQSSWKSLEGK